MTVAAVIAALLLLPLPAAAQIPRSAEQYRRQLIAAARFEFGLAAPVATMSGQVHQESSWRADAQSAYAQGLTQFVPSTAAWLSSKFPELGEPNPFNPAYALRAMARYDKYLHGRQAAAATECDRWAFVLSSYNGGEGNLNRDKRLAQSKGADPKKWWGHVEYFSPRAAWAFKENRGYPRRIIVTLQPRYVLAGWGVGVDCRFVT